jgi:hypothetical protein
VAVQQLPAHTAARAGPDAALVWVRMIVVRAAAAHACVEQAVFGWQPPPHTAIHHDAADSVGNVSVPRCCGWLRDVFGCRLYLQRNPSLLPEALLRCVHSDHVRCQQFLCNIVEHYEPPRRAAACLIGVPRFCGLFVPKDVRKIIARMVVSSHSQWTQHRAPKRK